MIPYEHAMLTLWFSFGLVGLARRFPRELGATVGFVAMLLFFQLAAERAGKLLYKATSAMGIDASQDLVCWVFYTAVILAVVGIVYVGETLTFAGEWPPDRLSGAIIDATIGWVNGWLVIGTWWYFGNKLNYPQQALGMYTPPLSSFGQRLVAITPLAIIPEDYALWIIAGALLLLLFLKFGR